MGAAELVRSLEAQDDSVCMGMAFADRLQAAVDEAYSQFVTDKVSGLTKRAKLRYPEADIRKLELVEERKLNRVLVAELASCGFMERCDNLVLMGFSGTGNYAKDPIMLRNGLASRAAALEPARSFA